MVKGVVRTGKNSVRGSGGGMKGLVDEVRQGCDCYKFKTRTTVREKNVGLDSPLTGTVYTEPSIDNLLKGVEYFLFSRPRYMLVRERGETGGRSRSCLYPYFGTENGTLYVLQSLSRSLTPVESRKGTDTRWVS